MQKHQLFGSHIGKLIKVLWLSVSELAYEKAEAVARNWFLYNAWTCKDRLATLLCECELQGNTKEDKVSQRCLIIRAQDTEYVLCAKVWGGS